MKDSRTTSQFIYFFSTPNSERNSRYMVPVQLTIFNEFNNFEENASLSLKYSKVNGRSILDEKYIKYTGIRSKHEVKHELNISDKFDYSLYKVDYLTKNGDLRITDGAFTSRIDYGDKFPVFFELGQGLDVEATVYSKRDIERKWSLKYRAVNVRSSDDLEWWVKDYYGKSIALDLRQELSFFRYLRGIIFGSKITIYGFEPKLIQVPENNLYIPKEDLSRYKIFRFDPYIARLLFNFSLVNKI
ncbi:hypothetical protein KQ940_09805 [Marinobacterium sp. D7]|uniref:hypothetical protein n=1 Tax=Marinobacterium ramblicola TaxID=2849041 RepID=UPI001C2D5F46|nr:hypothetical protein [Marinobacterium ramblicola]MBV1788350.1 hypothetical protein [Marinobacterium ramblicola]